MVSLRSRMTSRVDWDARGVGEISRRRGVDSDARREVERAGIVLMAR